ncbi:MAG: hypothetical protein ACREUZ_08920, partial [Burkholderiales bacterium]
MKRLWIATTLFAVATLAAGIAQDLADSTTSVTTRKAESGPDLRRRDLATDGFGRVPLAFEVNEGQTHGDVKFLARGRGYALFLTTREAILALQPVSSARPDAADRRTLTHRVNLDERQDGAIVRMQLVGARRDARIEGLGRQAGRVNYFVGGPAKWKRSVSMYSRVRSRDVYPGIDLIYYGNQGQLEYDFVVAPGASPAAIRLAFQGAALSIDTEGDLIGRIEGGEIRMRKPLIYQDDDGSRVPIDGGWMLARADDVRLRVGDYDHSKPLV